MDLLCKTHLPSTNRYTQEGPQETSFLQSLKKHVSEMSTSILRKLFRLGIIIGNVTTEMQCLFNSNNGTPESRGQVTELKYH